MHSEKDSTITRVSPLMKDLGKDKEKLNLFLSLFPKIRPIEADNKNIEIYYGTKEKALCPKQELLEWCINNLDKLTIPKNYGTKTKSTREKREQLFSGSESLKQEALKLIKQNPKKTSEWYIFEGYSKPDIYIETDSSIYIGEAKRMEPSLTTSTEWLNPRDQLIRHVDSIIDNPKKVYFFFVFAEDKITKYELSNYEDIHYYEKNLPHRKDINEIQKFMDSYCGFTTWERISELLGITFPDTVADVDL